MSEIVRPFHIMCKPVCGICNLDCRYCYYTMKPRELYPDTKTFLMGDDLLASYTRQYLEANPERCEFGCRAVSPPSPAKSSSAGPSRIRKSSAGPARW